MSMLSLATRPAIKSGIDQQVLGMEGQYGGTTYLPLYNLQTWTGNAVSPETALNIITVYQCVRLLSKTFATMPLHLYRRLPEGGKERAVDHPLYRTFHLQPNPDMTSHVWRELMLQHILTWGNAFNERVINGMGELELWPLRPDRMQVAWDDNGRKQYTYVYPSGKREVLPPEKVFHVPGMSSNGLVGFSPITLMRSTLSLMKIAETFGENVFVNGARPATVLSHPKNLSEPAIQRLATQMEALRGSGNSGKTVVLEEGLTITEVGFPPEDAQFMQTRLFQKREIVGAFGIPAHKVNDLEHATFTNIVEQNQDFISDGMMEHFDRFEQESEVQLTADEPDIFAEFEVDGYLRGDPVARANAYAVRWQHGTLNADDWRAKENENPLPDGLGKQYFVPVNYASINPPATETQPVAPTTSRETITEANKPPSTPPVVPPVLSVIKAMRPPSGQKPVEVRCQSVRVDGRTCNALLIPGLIGSASGTCGRCKTPYSVTTGTEVA